MPTPDGKKSIQDSLDIGQPYVDASGIAAKIYHQVGCRQAFAHCSCGVDEALRHLASKFAETLEQFGRRVVFEGYSYDADAWQEFWAGKDDKMTVADWRVRLDRQAAE